MAELRYPRRAIWADAGRATIGCGVTVLLAAQLPAGGFSFSLIAGVGVLFAAFGIVTVRRARTRIAVSDEGLVCWPGARVFDWDDLTEVRLNYYSTRRDREGGWMQLTLRGRDGRRLRVDSRVDGFTELVVASARAANDAGLVLDATTRHNVRAFDVGESEPGHKDGLPPS